ncbi:ABC-type sugar transport system, ATPase component [Salipiger thiooxidans]|uniref:ABC-type sugar transport system, ATPase component n=1 Tax=Salipiger thiooxidans TaxID=282683 RepID=A0A1G7CFJ9_9RHOB|nr:ABC-type sugar transport system, ATPase component [Salipiger thiooxidans]
MTPALRNVAMVFQQYSLYPDMTVRGDLAFPLKSPLLRYEEAQIARKLRADLRVELKNIQAQSGVPFLYVSHDQIEAMAMASHVGVRDQGRLVQFGSPRESARTRSASTPQAASASRASTSCPRICSPAPPRPRAISACAPSRSGRATAPRAESREPRAESRVIPVEHLGDQTRLHLSFRDHALITLTEPHTALRSGDTVRITPEPPFFSTPPAPSPSEEAAMRQFITLKEDIVAEAVDGVVSASGGRLARLEGYPHIRVVLRAD